MVFLEGKNENNTKRKKKNNLINDQFIVSQGNNIIMQSNYVSLFLLRTYIFFRSRTTLHFYLSLHFCMQSNTVIDWFSWFFYTALSTASNQLCCSWLFFTHFCDDFKKWVFPCLRFNLFVICTHKLLYIFFKR